MRKCYCDLCGKEKYENTLHRFRAELVLDNDEIFLKINQDVCWECRKQLFDKFKKLFGFEK